MAEVAPGKVRINVTLSEEVLDWVDENVKSHRFSSRSAALDNAASQLKSGCDTSIMNKFAYQIGRIPDDTESALLEMSRAANRFYGVHVLDIDHDNILGTIMTVTHYGKLSTISTTKFEGEDSK